MGVWTRDAWVRRDLMLVHEVKPVSQKYGVLCEFHAH
jgi:hypothetical protein